MLLRLLWTWLGMEITDVSAEPIPRQAARRAQRHLRSPRIRVVKLRKVRHATDAEGTHRDINWKCQWIVRGHHRHIGPYDQLAHRKGHMAEPNMGDPERRCLVCHARTTWVRPHCKGPDGMPLKVSKIIYRLAR
jgi:hypothetical protein